MECLDLKQQVRKSFSKAAGNYARLATFQQSAFEDLFQNATRTFPNDWGILLDLGCGPSKSPSLFPASSVIGIDLALGQCQQASASSLVCCADFDALPFGKESFDTVFSNLALQWSPQLAHSLSEIHRILKPGGRLIYSTLGLGTLAEFIQAKTELGFEQLAIPFLPPEDHLNALDQRGLRIQKTWRQPYRFSFDSPLLALKSLKNIGAQGLTQLLFSPEALLKILKHYPIDEKTGRYLLSYQVDHYLIIKNSTP